MSICWTVMIFLPHIWPMPLLTHTKFVSSKRSLISNKSVPITLSTVLEILRNDLKVMQTTLNTTVAKFDALETNISNLLSNKENHNSILQKFGSPLDPASDFNTTIHFTNDDLKALIFTNKLERISKIQERNSRLIVLEMTSLTNLAERLNRLENLIDSTRLNIEGKSEDSKLSTYEEQIVSLLSSIDKRLHSIPTPKIDNVTLTLKVNNDTGTKNHSSDAFSTKDTKTTLHNVFHQNYTIRSCDDLRGNKNNRSGVYSLDKNDIAMKMIWTNVSRINCDMETDGGGWTTIQRRGRPFGGRIDFNRTWNDYADGFGDLDGEFWFGNEVVHRMTFHHGRYELRIDLEDWEGQNVWAQYSDFELGTRMDGYRIKIAGYTGNATDSLSAHYSTPFSTYDRRNDYSPECCPCTADYGGGWWYYSCFEANLNGNYYTPDQFREPYRGIIWEHWRDDYSLRSTKMMIRLKYRNSLN